MNNPLILIKELSRKVNSMSTLLGGEQFRIHARIPMFNKCVRRVCIDQRTRRLIVSASHCLTLTLFDGGRVFRVPPSTPPPFPTPAKTRLSSQRTHQIHWFQYRSSAIHSIEWRCIAGALINRFRFQFNACINRKCVCVCVCVCGWSNNFLMLWLWWFNYTIRK